MRIAGLDKVPSAPMPRLDGVARPVLTEGQRRVRRARRALAARGLVEAVTWSFIPRATARVFGGGQDALELANPISTEMSSMRPSLLPGLPLGRTAQPQSRLRGPRPVRGGTGLSRRRARGPVHRRVRRARGRCAARWSWAPLVRRSPGGRSLRCQGRRGGTAGGAWFRRREGATDARRTGVVPSRPLRHAAARPQDRAGPFRRGPSRDAARARCRERRRRIRGVPQRYAAAKKEGAGAGRSRRRRSAARASRFRVRARPGRRRGRCRQSCAGSGQEADRRRQRVRPLRGREPGTGKKSLALEVTLQPREKTLTDQEIEAVVARVVAAVAKATGGAIRT